MDFFFFYGETLKKKNPECYVFSSLSAIWNYVGQEQAMSHLRWITGYEHNKGLFCLMLIKSCAINILVCVWTCGAVLVMPRWHLLYLKTQAIVTLTLKCPCRMHIFHFVSQCWNSKKLQLILVCVFSSFAQPTSSSTVSCNLLWLTCIYICFLKACSPWSEISEGEELQFQTCEESHYFVCDLIAV